MSVVSGVVLCASCAEDETIEDGPCALFEKINDWLAEKGSFKLNQVETNFGGRKHPQMFVAGGGFNYLPEDEFAEFVLSLPWNYPENVVLVIGPDQGATRVFRPQTETS